MRIHRIPHTPGHPRDIVSRPCSRPSSAGLAYVSHNFTALSSLPSGLAIGALMQPAS
jgi:hypothetical protein